ncbi:MAG: ester cyclase [Phaeodactylibacter sp.]|nr:ester cyclase [Phaeodactylibacter sp.]MCB9275288.1 ester cyclase [Lewinellaceae bacterium]
MERAETNKRFILKYIKALNEAEDKLQALSQYTSDPKLIEHVTFLEQAFPRYQVMVDEVTAEACRVIVRARFIGKHRGPINGMGPTGKTVQVPFAMGYEVRQNKIIAHWLITDQLALLIQSVV